MQQSSLPSSFKKSLSLSLSDIKDIGPPRSLFNPEVFGRGPLDTVHGFSDLIFLPLFYGFGSFVVNRDFLFVDTVLSVFLDGLAAFSFAFSDIFLIWQCFQLYFGFLQEMVVEIYVCFFHYICNCSFFGKYSRRICCSSFGYTW